MSERIGDILVRKGVLSSDNLRKALRIQKEGDKALPIVPGEKVGRILLLKKFVEPMDLVRTLYEQKGSIDFLSVGDYIMEPRVATWVPPALAAKHSFLPLVSMDDDSLIVASPRKIPPKELLAIEGLVDKKIEVVNVDDRGIKNAIRQGYELLKRRGISSVRIGEILVRDGFLSQEEINEALEESVSSQRMLGRILIERGRVNEEDFFRLLSLQRKMSLAHARDILPELDKSLVKDISKAFCLRNLVAPYKREIEKVYVVTAEPSLDPTELCIALKCKVIDISLITYTDIETILRALYSRENVQATDVIRLDVEELEDMPLEVNHTPLEDDIETLTIRYTKVTGAIMLEAIKKGASDIHLECFDKGVALRLRVDGTLYDVDHLQLNKKNITGVVNVLKVQSGMDIAERRLPQSGRFRKKVKDGMVYDFRLQSQPTIYGENMIIRVLDQAAPLLPFADLGFSPAMLTRYEKVIKNPSGLILITGPTGSGKTTTLYSTIGMLRRDLRKKIITIEDPVEYSLERIQQCQVKEEIGFGFPQAVRAFLREDPDMLLVGEIRDRDTALEVMRASQTGHMVLSTIHTNNTVESVQRLLDLNLDPATITSELIAVISQRLAKKNCTECTKPYRPSKELLGEFYPYGAPEAANFCKSPGCKSCNFMGHKGRIAVLECWFLDSRSKELILKRASFEDISAAAVAGGMIPMIRDALSKVEAGIIALDELSDIIPYYEIMKLKDDFSPPADIHEPIKHKLESN